MELKSNNKDHAELMPKNNSGMIYQPVGDLILEIPNHQKVENYYRDLNIEKALATVTFMKETPNIIQRVN